LLDRTGVNLNDFPGGNLSGQPGGKFTEFFHLKKEYIKSGLNEFAAEQRYKDAYGNYSDIELDSIRNNRSHDIKRDMLEMMFPNDDIDSEDFEDGLDFEDMND